MKIGIAFDLKPTSPLPAGAPDDLHEEFDAPVTIRAIAAALRELGHDVVELGNNREFLEKILADPPDAVFNFAEGTGTSRSREARVPAVCEMLGIPYTGSDPLALAVSLDKDMTRRLVAEAGVAVPAGMLLGPPREKYEGDFAEFEPLLEASGLPLPAIAKPVFEGSSKGIRSKCLVTAAADLGPAVVGLWNDYRQPVLVEEFIDGPEVTVGIVGSDPPQVLGIMGIAPKVAVPHFVYSLEVKRDYVAQVEYACPPALPADVLRDVEAAALTAFDALGCSDVSRIDFRIRDGVPYFIELNPLPGLNPESSDLVIMASLVGVSHAELVQRIFRAAESRWKTASGR